MNARFKYLIDRNCKGAFSRAITTVIGFSLVAIVCIGLAILSVYMDSTKLTVELFFFSMLTVALVVYLYRKHKGGLKGPNFWLRMIKDKPDDIIWIKPVVIKHTVGYVVTLYKEQTFQIIAKNGYKVFINCDSKYNLDVFFKGIQECLPNAQLGYSREIAVLYAQNPGTFIEALKVEGLYTPVSIYKFE